MPSDDINTFTLNTHFYVISNGVYITFMPSVVSTFHCVIDNLGMEEIALKLFHYLSIRLSKDEKW